MKKNKEVQITISESNNIERILSLFDNSEEQKIIYNKLLEVSPSVIIERAKATEGMDDQAIVKMVREYL